MEALITLANLIYLLSYFVQDMLRLRVLTILAACLLLGYFWLRPEPIMAVVYWNAFFILLNGLQVVRILYQRRAGFDPFDCLLAAMGAPVRRALPWWPGTSSRCAAS